MGFIQVFKDSHCLQYYDGSPQAVIFVRFNYGWVAGENTSWGRDSSEELTIGTPEEGAEYYDVSIYVDWYANLGNSQPYAGQVVAASAPDDTYGVTDPHVIFYADGSSSVAP